MLARLSASSKTLLRSKTSSLSAPKASQRHSLSAKNNLSSPKPLTASFGLSSSSLASSITSTIHHSAMKRSYATASSISQVQLDGALETATKDALLDFDTDSFEQLLNDNGWNLVLNGTEVSLTQNFEDAVVTVEVYSETQDLQSAMEKLIKGEEPSSGGHYHEDGSYHQGEHHVDGEDDAASGAASALKGQHDYFSVIISKPKINEKLIFGCHAKDGTLMIDNVVITHPSYIHKHGQITSAGVKIEDPQLKASVERVNRSVSFNSFSDDVKASMENYLLEHGINHDMAQIVYMALYKADLQYDQEFASMASKFLRSGKL